MKLNETAGATSRIWHVFIQDSSSAVGAGLTGLLYNSAGLSAYYMREGASAAVAVTLANIVTLGTYVSGGFKEVDATNLPGVYEFHPPDAMLAAGAESVSLLLKGASNMAPCPAEVQILASSGVATGGGANHSERKESKGATSRIWHVFIQDAAGPPGKGLTGLNYNSAGLSAYYMREGASAAVAVTLINIGTLGTYGVGGGFKEVDATNMPGVYEFQPPDAMLATGADSVSLLLQGATDMVPTEVVASLEATGGGGPEVLVLRETPGNTSRTWHVFIQDANGAPGDGLTGLAYNTPGLSASYRREEEASVTSITLATTSPSSPWVSGGFVEVDATNMPGVYQFNVPDAVLASGAQTAVVEFLGAAGMLPARILVELVPRDFYSPPIVNLERGGASGLIYHVFIQDINGEPGEGLTGLAYNTPGLVAGYVRAGETVGHAIPLIDIPVLGFFYLSGGGFKEYDAVNFPGVYEFQLPTLMLGGSYGRCILELRGAANMVPVRMIFQEKELINDSSEVNEDYGAAIRIIRAACAGEGTGFPLGPVQYSDKSNTIARITATVDANGNRTSVTTNGS